MVAQLQAAVDACLRGAVLSGRLGPGHRARRRAGARERVLRLARVRVPSHALLMLTPWRCRRRRGPDPRRVRRRRFAGGAASCSGALGQHIAQMPGPCPAGPARAGPVPLSLFPRFKFDITNSSLDVMAGYTGEGLQSYDCLAVS